MSEAMWYFAKDNQQHGPVSETELRQLFAAGQLQADALVWTQGMQAWTPANQVGGLAPGAENDIETYATYTTEHPKLQAEDFESQPEQFRFDQPGQAPSQEVPLVAPDGNQYANFDSPYEKQPDGEPASMSAYQPGDATTQFANANCEAPGEARSQQFSAYQPSPGDWHQQPVGGYGTAATTSSFEAEPDWPGASNNPPAQFQPLTAHYPEPDYVPDQPPQQPVVGTSLEPEVAPLAGGERAGQQTLDGPETGLGARFGIPDRFNLVEELDSIPTPKAVKSLPASGAVASAKDKVAPNRMYVDPTSSSTHKAVGRIRGVSGERSAINKTTSLASSLIKRLCARTIDLFLFGIPGALFYLIVVSQAVLTTHAKIDNVVLTLLKTACEFTLVAMCLGMELLVLTAWGTTPGKRLLGIELSDATTGEPLSREQSVQRTLWFYLYSGLLFFWLPFLIGKVVMGLCSTFQVYTLLNAGATSYDTRAGVRCDDGG